MSYSSNFGSRPGWSAVIDGIAQLVQVATAAASARLLHDPDVRGLVPRGFVVPYSADPDLARRSADRYAAAVAGIAAEYRLLSLCLRRLQQELRYTRQQAHDLTWDELARRNAAHDCTEIDRLRHQIGQHITQCAILHAQAVCSVTAILDDVNTAFICPPHPCDTFAPVGSPYSAPTAAPAASPFEMREGAATENDTDEDLEPDEQGEPEPEPEPPSLGPQGRGNRRAGGRSTR
jgi:hypothetical protein